MKLLSTFLLLFVAFRLMAIESGTIPANVTRPHSVFENTGKDPFSRPTKRPAIAVILKEGPVFQFSLNAVTVKNDKRSALISGAVVTEGETGFLKNGDSSIKFICKEIRDTSVVVQVSNCDAPIELIFGQAVKVNEKGIPSVLTK